MKKEKQKGFKTLGCKYCNNPVERVDINSIAVTCSRCTHRLSVGEQPLTPEGLKELNNSL